MRLGIGVRKAAFLALASLCATAISTPPAAAKTPHHHARHMVYAAPVYRAAPPDMGFGPTAPGVSSIVVDAESGQVIAATGADIPRYPASLTKLMTLDLAFQALRAGRMTLDTVLPISYHAASVEPVKLGLQPGDVITVREAILAMTTMSANDAATALGEYLGGGSEARCAQMMTLRAHALGMAQTQFYNASGLPNPNQITTARDLAILARDIVVSYPEDQSFFEVQEFDFNGHSVYSNNAMLKIYPGATGMKTGYTILARHNLITSAQRNGKVLIGVVLHEPSWGQTYAQMTAMLDDGFGGHVAPATTQIAQAAPPPPSVPRLAAAPVQTVISHRAPAGRPIDMANNKPPSPYVDASWTAQLGVYSHMAKARVEAISARELRGMGIPRIARLERHGKILWTAQLAGLTLSGAHQTCNALAARGTACVIIAPQSDHLAMRDTGNG
jgi:D-alanyl-D-alanine carboxypeptidase